MPKAVGHRQGDQIKILESHSPAPAGRWIFSTSDKQSRAASLYDFDVSKSVQFMGTLLSFIHTFECDGSDDPVPALCEQLLDFLQSYCADYIKMADNEYGGLNGYYIANKENNPGIAGLAYLDRGDINGAIECFSSPRIEHCKNVTILVDVENHKQLRRVLENGNTTSVSEYGECTSRRLQDLFNDYAVALQNGLEWNYDRAMFGLLKKERNRWSIFSIIHRILKIRSRTETCGNA